ncbi:hypothetical protein WDU94_005092 [Cyamophila willieti]
MNPSLTGRNVCRDLRCLRNKIHTNLMCTYILADFMWILMQVWMMTSRDLRCLRNKIHTQSDVHLHSGGLHVDPDASLDDDSPGCGIKSAYQSNFACVILFSLHYCHLTNFFWMFVEGLYLYMLVVETFSSANIKLRVYFIIGWGEYY